MKRVLVTGATGFIGRNCLQRLIARGFEVHAVSSKPVIAREPGLIWHHANLLDNNQVPSLISEAAATHLLHLAWYAEHGKFWEAGENHLWKEASIALFQSFLDHGGKRILAAGTCAEYDWKYGCCSESRTPLNPATLYGKSKAQTHLALASLTEQAGSSYVWGRIFYLYGADEPPTRLIPFVIRALLEGKSADCTAATQIRDFLEVRDVADALVATLDCDVCGPVNIASGQPVALCDLIGLIGRKIGRSDLINLGARPTLPNDPDTLIAEVGRLEEEVVWAPKISLDKGLDHAITWWREKECGGNACVV